LVVCPPAAQAFSFSLVHTFGSTGDGTQPIGGLTRKNHRLWGTTCTGGGSGFGTVYRFKISNPSIYNVVYNFSGPSDGSCPAADLTHVGGGGGGTFYGVTWFGGNLSGFHGGTVFKIQANAPFGYTQLYKFNGGLSDGERPLGQLTYNAGLLWGTTELGGNVNGNFGTVFTVPASGGSDTIKYNFTGPLLDGDVPEVGLTYVASSNTFFGTTGKGGTDTNGTAFKIDTAGSYTLLHSFGPSNTPSDGGLPRTKLIKVGGIFYGANAGNTLFKMNPGGAVTLIYTFAGYPGDGDFPTGDIVYANLGSGPRIYGTTETGGANDMGTVFEIDPATGVETSLYNFTGGSDGAYPESGLQMVTVGGMPVLYGTASAGGSGSGTIFKVQ
jgi:uncharacterized repeat protein (TIGR03803 family)